MSRTKDKIKLEYFEMPTIGGDPIVESGSNSDGEWTRWADGSQMCSGNKVSTNSGNSGVGSSDLFNHPISFLSDVTVVGSSINPTSSRDVSVGNSGVVASQEYRAVSYNKDDGTSPAGGVSDEFFFHAIGRWK